MADPSWGLHPEDGASWLGLIGQNVYRLATNFWRLGYTDRQPELVSAAIAGIAIVGWLWAAWRAARALRDRQLRASLVNGAGYIAASLFLLAWVAVFPEHTWRHDWMMVRSAMIWVAAGWGWALTDYAASRVWQPRMPAG